MPFPYLDQQDAVEAATFAVARTALSRGKLGLPSIRELGEDLAIAAAVNVAGPKVDEMVPALAGLPPQAGRMIKFALADAAARLLMGKGAMSGLTVKNLAAIAAGVYAGDMLAARLPENVIPGLTTMPSANALHAARRATAMANPLTTEGV